MVLPSLKNFIKKKLLNGIDKGDKMDGQFSKQASKQASKH